jgi:hypothetical protein
MMLSIAAFSMATKNRGFVFQTESLVSGENLSEFSVRGYDLAVNG